MEDKLSWVYKTKIHCLKVCGWSYCKSVGGVIGSKHCVGGVIASKHECGQ